MKRILSKVLGPCLFFARARSKERLFRYLEIAVFVFVVVINLSFIWNSGFKGKLSLCLNNSPAAILDRTYNWYIWVFILFSNYMVPWDLKTSFCQAGKAGENFLGGFEGGRINLALGSLESRFFKFLFS